MARYSGLANALGRSRSHLNRGDLMVRHTQISPEKRASIIRPDAWSGELKQVGIRIPEIQTGTASLPLNFRFNFDSTLAESRSPSLERI
jgi:hypothetical protein